MKSERLQKILARGGIASRRAAEQIITSGRVRVNGKVVTELGAKAHPLNDKIEIDGKRVITESAVYVLLHKPRGVVSTLSDPEGRPSVKELLASVGARVFPIGRLDFATSGALLATNDGETADGLMHPRRAVPKTYVCKVSGEMKPADVEKWKRGVRLEDGMTLPADVKILRHEAGKTWIELTIREGRNQQIRRMGEATGFPVMRLARVAFAGITTDDLRPGQWRHLTREELVALKKAYGVPKKTPHAPEEEAGPQGRVQQRARRPERGTERGPARPESRTTGPRYGGGAPGRRGIDVKDDWGGGVSRGRSFRAADAPRAARGDHGDAPPRGDLGGRGGRSRTTGTGGGIQGTGNDASYRIRGRRGR